MDTMAETWDQMVARRSAEPGAAEAYEAARLAYELGEKVRAAREKRGWSQEQLAAAARMRQPAVARFEAGGTVPKLDTVQRLLTALGGRLAVTFPNSRSSRPTRATAQKAAAKKAATKQTPAPRKPAPARATLAKKAASPNKATRAAKKAPATRAPRVSA
jgi:transcriptional regulator with XRE-family HTH domain